MSCIILFIEQTCGRKTQCNKCFKPILKGENCVRGLAKLAKTYLSFHKDCYKKVLKENLKELEK